MHPHRTAPELSALFVDPRGGERALRVTWHQEREVVVLSLWREAVCAASFRLDVDEVPDLIAMLREGLDLSFRAHRDDAREAPAADRTAPIAEVG